MTSPPLRERWTQLRSNPHVCTECNAVVFVLLAIATIVAGLYVAAVACALFAIVFFGSDAFDWWREHH